MRLNALAFGAACALLLGVGVCGATFVSVGKGKKQTLRALAAPFPYYTVTTKGAFIGLAWGLGYGFVAGLGFAVVYNLATAVFSGRKT
jgi:hypothetical protein